MFSKVDRLRDVMSKIAHPKTFNLVEAHELRLMNNDWKKHVPKLKDGGYTGTEPWLLFHGKGAAQAFLYDPLRNRRYGTEDVNFQDSRVLGSHLGWVVGLDSVSTNPHPQHNVFLYNPFAMLRFDLPVLNIQFPQPNCVVRYGVVTNDPLNDGSFACVITDCSMVLGGLAAFPLFLHYIAKTNGVWEPMWNVASIPIVDDDDAPDHFDYRSVEHISPSHNTVSICLTDGRTYEFNLLTQNWDITFTPVPHPMDFNRFEDLTIHEVKARLRLQGNIPTSVELMGTKTDRYRVKNKFASDDASTSEVDGVWVEVRL